MEAFQTETSFHHGYNFFLLKLRDAYKWFVNFGERETLFFVYNFDGQQLNN